MFSWKKFISSKNNLCSALIDYMIQVPIINYNLRHFQKLANTKKNSVKMGLETILYHTPQLWNLVSIDIKDTLSLSPFKKKKKNPMYTPFLTLISYVVIVLQNERTNVILKKSQT